MLCSGMGAALTVLSSSGLATSFTGAGVVVGGPLIAVASLLTMVSTSISLNIRLVMCKAQKRERLQILAKDTLSNVKRLTYPG